MVWLDRPELVVLPDNSYTFLTVPLIFYSSFKFLCRVGTHLAFKSHLSIQKMRENASTNRKKGTKNPRKNSANKEKESIKGGFFGVKRHVYIYENAHLL